MQRFRKATAAGRGRLLTGLRIATTLFLLAPRALAANRFEAGLSAEEVSRLPPICSSLTIEVTVWHEVMV